MNQNRNIVSIGLLIIIAAMAVWTAARPTDAILLPVWFGVVGLAGATIGLYAGFALQQKVSNNQDRMANPTYSKLHPDLLSHLQKAPELLNFAPRTLAITLMHVEIIAFHDMIRRFTPVQIMQHMQETYDQVSKAVSNFGGFILPGYRGGFLLAFGDPFNVKYLRSSHADRALFCGHALQKETASRLSQLIGQEGPAFSLRIGVVTSQTFIGNLGKQHRLDIALLGDAIGEVEAASRSGSMGSLTVSELTVDLAETLSRTSQLVKERHVALPDGSDGIFYDVDVFFEQDGIRSAMAAAVKQASGVQRKEARFNIDDNNAIQLVSELGQTKLLNISRNGLGIACESIVQKGETIQLSISTKSPRVNAKLKGRSLTTFSAEVVFIASDGKQIGLIHKTVPRRERDFLLYAILEAVETC